MEIELFPYYFVITKTPNLSTVKYILADIKQYSPNKKSKAQWENYIHTLQYG